MAFDIRMVKLIRDGARSGFENSTANQAFIQLAQDDIHVVSSHLKMTYLHYCAVYGNRVIAQHLIDRGSNVNAQDSAGWTALNFAILTDQHVVTKMLLQNNAQLYYSTGLSIIRFAFLNWRGPPSRVMARILVEALSTRLPSGEAARELFENGCKTYDAVYSKSAEIMREIIYLGADVNESEPVQRRTALHVSAILGDLNTAAVLLYFGAEINAQDFMERTPLSYVYPEPLLFHTDTARVALTGLLIAAGAATTNSHTANGQCQLTSVITNGPATAVQLAVNIIDIESLRLTDWCRNTIGHEMSRNPVSTTNALRIFFQRSGSDIDCVNIFNESILAKSATHGQVELLKSLLEWGARTYRRDWRLRTPLIKIALIPEIHIRRNHLLCAYHLLQGGADPQVTVMRQHVVLTIFEFCQLSGNWQLSNQSICQIVVADALLRRPIRQYTLASLNRYPQHLDYLNNCRELMAVHFMEEITVGQLLLEDLALFTSRFSNWGMFNNLRNSVTNLHLEVDYNYYVLMAQERLRRVHRRRTHINVARDFMASRLGLTAYHSSIVRVTESMDDDTLANIHQVWIGEE